MNVTTSQQVPPARSTVWDAAGIALLAVAVLVAVRIGLALPGTPTGISPVWPETGVSILALLYGGRRLWPGVALGAGLGAWSFGFPLSGACVTAATSTLEALVAVSVILWTRRRSATADAPTPMMLVGVLVGVAAGSIISTTIGVATFARFGHLSGLEPAHAARVWWLGNLIGAALVAPALLPGRQGLRLPGFSRRELLGLGLTAAALAGAALLAYGFSGPPNDASAFALSIVPVPVAIWSAFRFGIPGAVLANLVVGSVAVWFTGRQVGPFAFNEQAGGHLALQVFLVIFCANTLGIAALVRQRNEAQRNLQRSETRLRSIAERIPGVAFSYVSGAEGRRRTLFFGSGVADLVGPETAKRVGADIQRWLDNVHPDDRPALDESRERVEQGLDPQEDLAYRVRTDEGRWRWIRPFVRGTMLGDGAILWEGVLVDVDEQKRAEALLAERDRIVRLTAEGAPLADVMAELARGVERIEPGMTCSILLLDDTGRRLHTLAGAGLPEAYNRMIDGIEIGPTAGSCGAAAYLGRRVIAEDLRTHPNWAGLDEAVRVSGKLACWSEPFRSRNGKVIGTLAMYYDEPRRPSARDLRMIEHFAKIAGIVIDRHRDQAALRRARFALESASDAIFIADVDGVILDVNRAACEGLGYAREDLIGQPVSKVAPDDGPKWASHLDELASEGATLLATRHVRKDGSSFPVEVSCAAFEVDGRRFVCGAARNVAERVEAERRLRESEEQLELALQGADLGLWDWDLRTDAVLVNDRWVSMIGFDRDEIDQTLAFWKERTHPDDGRRALAAARAHVEGRAPMYEAEFRMRAKDGSWRWIMARGGVVERDEEGRAVRMVGTHLDLTERKRLEAELTQTQKMEAIGRFASGVAHDVGNVLAAIRIAASTLRAGIDGDAAMRDAVTEIEDAAAHGERTTRSLLAFAHRGTAERRPMSLTAALKPALRLIRRSMPARIAVRIKAPESGPVVDADETQLQQALVNLAFNARDAMSGEGELVIELVAEGGEAVIRVSDTGEGMDGDAQRRAFEPFFSTKNPGDGSGLGLSIVHGVVKEHGGRVELRSDAGAGTTIELRLPLSAAPAPADDRPSPRRPRPFVGRSAVVISSDRLSRAVLTSLLDELGFNVEPLPPAARLSDNDNALRLADLALVDDASCAGTAETARTLRAHGFEAPILRIGPTNGKAPGGDYLAKPFAIDDLRAAVQRLIAPGASTP